MRSAVGAFCLGTNRVAVRRRRLEVVVFFAAVAVACAVVGCVVVLAEWAVVELLEGLAAEDFEAEDVLDDDVVWAFSRPCALAAQSSRHVGTARKTKNERRILSGTLPAGHTMPGQCGATERPFPHPNHTPASRPPSREPPGRRRQ